MPAQRKPRLATLLLAACGLAAAAAPAFAGRLANLDVVDRDTGRTLPQYRHDGRLYVAGEPGHRYEISVRNQLGERLLAVMSVDGVNVLSGETAGTGQGGYVFAPWEQDAIKGWRKNLDEIAQFHFTALPNSYAARTARPNDVGVIGVALFREVQPLPAPPYCCDDEYRRDEYPAQPNRAEDRAANESGGGSALGRAAPSAAAKSESSRADAAPEPKRRAAPKLGTGHGARERSVVGTTSFERASSEPDEVITLYYDSRPNLIAQGVLPDHYRIARHRPQPFPGGFVPNP